MQGANAEVLKWEGDVSMGLGFSISAFAPLSFRCSVLFKSVFSRIDHRARKNQIPNNRAFKGEL
jgi:hypothetical protein